jgi:branched-chain amino acid aminotransferase
MYHESVKYIYFNDGIVPYEEARVHVLTPAMRYGSTVFEGIRGYWNEEDQELYVLQLREHMERLIQSAKLMEFVFDYSLERLCELTVETIKKNDLRKDIHIRPIVYLGGSGEVHAKEPTFLVIAAMPVGRLFSVDQGINCCVSSWSRINDNSLPPRIKCAANYQNSRLVMLQAKKDHYDNAIILNASGKVSESPGACLFIVRKGRPTTTPVTSGILESITRDTVMSILKEYFSLDTEVREMDRTELYVADEAFLCGSGAEIAPIVTVDKYVLNGGKIGPLTKKVQDIYFRIVRGQIKDHPEWRTAVYTKGK